MLTSVFQRLQLSRAKHRSIHGHARLSKRLARLVPFYEYGPDRFFAADGAPFEVAERRQAGFARLAHTLATRAPLTLAATATAAETISDLQFTGRYRVPFQFRRLVGEQLKVGSFLESSDGVRVRDLDGNVAFDLTGSYGVNVFGHERYKRCIEAGVARVRDLGPVLGSYHPVVLSNADRLRRLSGLDEVSFHMSGTEAVMQAVRLARYHTGRSHLVQFAGAYHGWWDGVQAGVGNPRPVRDVYTLKEVDDATLRVLRTRRDIACVLVNPLQALHPNASAPGDAALLASDRQARFDRQAYTRWLQQLRDICTDRGIPLIFDEVFVGFRLARGGAQEYFGVRADLVTYGKTIAGGLPIGVVCGRRALMRRFREDRPTDVCFARGTFNSHPYVMGAMDAFLTFLESPEGGEAYADIDAIWDRRIGQINSALAAAHLPVRLANLVSIATICYDTPSRYNWMFQYYLRAAGLALSWVGSGRLVFSHDYTDADMAGVTERIVEAARAMHDDGWWWHQPSLTNAGIRRQVLFEMLAARLFGHA